MCNYNHLLSSARTVTNKIQHPPCSFPRLMLEPFHWMMPAQDNARNSHWNGLKHVQTPLVPERVGINPQGKLDDAIY